jgi:uncharacterized protein (TIGR02145 family)
MYYIRAYATNSAGTAYGQDVQVNTASFSSPVTDIDGNVYGTVVIGTQTWMAENLKTTRYRDGSSIPYVLDNNTWSGLSGGAWCYFNHDNSNNALYGKLYNWYAVDDARNLCPAGWHVPTDAEWTTMDNFLGGVSVAGGKMKAVSGLWSNPNLGATNESGFSGLPGGSRASNGIFFNIGRYGNWWSSSEISVAAFSRGLSYDNADSGRSSNYNSNGFSVRCLKD